MSDLENMSEETTANDQPALVVETETEETVDTPHVDDTDQVTFVIEEDEGDQSNKPNDEEAKKRAAFAKAKRKKREAQEQAAREKERADRLEREIAELRQQVTAKPKPTMEGCDYDHERYEQELSDWYSSQSSTTTPSAPAQTTQQAPDFDPDDEAEYIMHQGEEALRKQGSGITDYDDRKKSLADKIRAMNVDPEQVFNQWASLAREDGTYNVSNALYMIDRNPDAINEIAAQTSVIGINRVLKKYASKLKVQKKKPVPKEPTDINHGGRIDNATAAVDKARQAWKDAKTPQQQQSKWAEYQAIKQGK